MNNYCIGTHYTIKEAIDSINAAKNRVIIVVNHDDKVIGVISQGDIIRALMYGSSLYTRVETIVRANFLYLNNKDMEKAYSLFKKAQITLLPIVDDDFHLIDVVTISDIYEYLEGICKNSL